MTPGRPNVADQSACGHLIACTSGSLVQGTAARQCVQTPPCLLAVHDETDVPISCVHICAPVVSEYQHPSFNCVKNKGGRLWKKKITQGFKKGGAVAGKRTHLSKVGLGGR